MEETENIRVNNENNRLLSRQWKKIVNYSESKSRKKLTLFTQWSKTVRYEVLPEFTEYKLSPYFITTRAYVSTPVYHNTQTMDE